MSIDGDKIQRRIRTMNEAVQDAKNNLEKSGLSEHPTAANILKEVENFITARNAGFSPLAVNEFLGTPKANKEKYTEQAKLLRPLEVKINRELTKLETFIKDFSSLKDSANLAKSVKEGRTPF